MRTDLEKLDVQMQNDASRHGMKRFDRYVGIDWSGDAKPRQKGIAVAVAEPGCTAPAIIRPLDGRNWSRRGIVDWIAATSLSRRTLIGFDFAFAFPRLPAGPLPPTWAELDDFCRLDANFYGGRFFDGSDHALRDHVFGRQWKGALFDRSAQRQTEKRASDVRGAQPSTPFLAIGPAQVGPSSVSGMRALHALRTELGDQLSVWPFAPDQGEGLIVVEIFPRYYPLRVGLAATMRVQTLLNAALAAYGSEPVTVSPRSEDEGDALISAAALRTLSADTRMWGPLPSEAAHEGWIFGVPTGM